MSEERKKILEMLAAGQITAQDADRLLSAVEGPSGESATATATASLPKNAPKFLRVLIDGTDKKNGGPVHINMRIPIILLRAGVRLASVIPPHAQQRVNDQLRKQGVDFDLTQIKPENVNELLDQLRDVAIDIDHTSADPDRKQDDVKIKIFAE